MNPSNRFPSALVVALSLVVVGCLNPHRIQGPDHSADGPAYVSSSASAAPAPLDLAHRVVLIGDAGLYLEEDPTLAKLGAWTDDAANSTVLYLGDNIYNEGLEDDDRERGEQILAQQLAATGARKILVPGNHDWGLFEMREKSIQNQQEYVAEWEDGRAEFLPRDGCMGPAVVTLSPVPPLRALTLVVTDPSPIVLNDPTIGCEGENDLATHIAEVEVALASAEPDWVILASHYPLETGGPHGGMTYGSLLADGILNTIRFWGGTTADVYDPGYVEWIDAMTEVMRKHPPELYAAGHDHNLQVLDGHDYAGLEVVSGAGAVERVSTVTHLPNTFFAHAAPGFVVVDFGTRDGEDAAVLRVVEANADGTVFEMELPAVE